MLELHNIVKRYGKELIAVNDVTMKLTHGVVGLIGHNGAGKTTLMQMIATLALPSSGQILLDGQDVARKPQMIRARLGYLPQDFGIYPNLSALEFMQYFAALKGCRDPKRISHLLELVNLHEQAHRPAASFSGGMRRRLGIAQALINDPDIVIVDEPTAGLDPEERMRFRQLISELGFRKLVIMSTHIVSDVESIATQLAIMRSGRLVAFETPETILAQSAGQIWSAEMDAQSYEGLRSRLHILNAQRQGNVMTVRIAHPHQPCFEAVPVQASLEEALMAQRYAQQEVLA